MGISQTCMIKQLKFYDFCSKQRFLMNRAFLIIYSKLWETTFFETSVG